MLWKVPTVDLEPVIRLDFWQICKSSEGTFHFAGYHFGVGRCSSKIVSFDKSALTGTTRSGRKYHLVRDGRGFNRDSASCAEQWFKLNKMTYEVVNPEDVTV